MDSVALQAGSDLAVDKRLSLISFSGKETEDNSKNGVISSESKYSSATE